MHKILATAEVQMLRKLMLAMVVALGSLPAIAADLTLPANAPTAYPWNKKVVAKEDQSCTSQHKICTPVCTKRNDMAAMTDCNRDCDLRLKYCKSDGYYPWISGPSVQVGKRD